MFRFQPHFNRLFLPLALVGLHLFAAEVMAQDDAKETLVYSPPTVNLAADQTMIDACNGDTALVHLTAKATSPSNNSIRYRWTVNGGRIEGDGSAVTWNLTGAQPGQHKASLVINTGNGDEFCEAFANTIVAVRCALPKPTCPNVSIVCPEPVTTGQPVTFTSALTGGTGNVPRIYNWTVSAGRIIEGQGTNSITVDTNGLEGQTLTAGLAMSGYEEVCSASCSIQFPIPLTCRRFDEFPEISRNDEKARLDNFAIELQNDPTSIAYVIIYPGLRDRSGVAQTRSTGIVDYMVNSRRFEARRMVTLVGPAREQSKAQLWACPQGAQPPKP